MRLWLVILVGFFGLAFALHTPDNFVNCGSYPPSCGGAFCQDSLGSPAICPEGYNPVPLKTTSDGHFFCGLSSVSRCCIPLSCGSGGGGPPPYTPVCTSVELRGPQDDSRGFPPGHFYGYNWTQAWIDRCLSEPGTPCGMVPSEHFFVECRDQQGAAMTCPQGIQWNANLGTLEPDPIAQNDVPNEAHQHREWRSPNVPGSVTITVTVPNCGVDAYQFQHHVLDACSVSPEDARLQPGQIQDYAFSCLTSQGAPAACYYALSVHAFPDFPEPIGAFDKDVVDFRDPQARFTASNAVSRGEITGGGPTFSCSTPVTVGRPAVSCTLSPNSAQLTQFESQAFQAQCLDELGAATSCPNGFWEVPLGLGFVTPNGVFTAGGVGNTLVRFRAEGTQFVPPISCDAPVSITPAVNPCTDLPRVGSFSRPPTTNFQDALDALGNLEAVPGAVLGRSNEFEIRFSAPLFACGQDFDGQIRSSTGFLAVNANNLHASIRQPVHVLLYDLPYDAPPQLMVSDAFAQNPSQVIQNGVDCVLSGRCTDVSYDVPSRTLSFRTNGFSSFATTESGSPIASPSPAHGVEQLELDCPLPQIGVNTTRASVFYFSGGRPLANDSMELVYRFEGGTFALAPSAVYPATGEHVFVVNVRTLGNYSLQANANGSFSNACAFSVLQEDASAIPELPELLMVFVALLAFAWTRRRI